MHDYTFCSPTQIQTYNTMKKIFYFLLPLTIFATSICSCSSDDSSYNPYFHQEKSPFYPNEIRIEKQSGKRDISEKWTFEYNTDRTISAYTHETTTKQQKEGYIETTVEKESGSLSYYNNGNIVNVISTEKEIFGYDYQKYSKERIIENVECVEGRITAIERMIDSYNKDGVKTSSTTTNRTFEYAGEHCVASTYTDRDNAAGHITHTYTYNWDGGCRLTSIDIDEKGGDSRTRKTYNYTYGKLGTNHVFQANAFLYNHMPQIYAAMGYMGKDCPYTLYREEQVFKLFIDGRWEVDNSADNKIFTLINNGTDEFKYDISSDIYSTNYDIKFIK